MILIDILKKIFGKKKKAVAPTPPVIYTPPTPQITPIKIENDDVNDFSLQSSLFSLRMKELGVENEIYGKGIKDLEDYFKLITNPTQEQIVENKTLKNAFIKRYETNGLLLVQDIQYRAKNLVNIFNKETDLQKKKNYSNFYLPLRAELNKVYDNFLVGNGYAMTFAVTTTPTTREAQNPNTGGAMQQGTNTGATPTTTTTTTTTTPVNNTQYNTWSDYSTNTVFYPNEIVWSNGSLYKALTVIGRNVQPLPTDGRWLKL